MLTLQQDLHANWAFPEAVESLMSFTEIFKWRQTRKVAYLIFYRKAKMTLELFLGNK